ncbi:hypothetical protein V8G54_029762 [Vigna mungo]|uniref:Uncharacterized protein n=1 Tax=Vigna mungo TaxID=3915 RepID=A0AAQ3MV46_VIGMU
MSSPNLSPPLSTSPLAASLHGCHYRNRKSSSSSTITTNPPLTRQTLASSSHHLRQDHLLHQKPPLQNLQQQRRSHCLALQPSVAKGEREGVCVSESETNLKFLLLFEGEGWKVVTTRIGTLNRKPESCTLRINCTQLGRDIGASSERVGVDALDNGGDGEESNVEWKSEFLGEVDSLGYRTPTKNREKVQRSKLLEETDEMDWCMRARKKALKSIEAKGMSHLIEDLVTVKKKKKDKKKVLVKLLQPRGRAICVNSSTKYA